MYYTIYKITNLVNNKIYIGKHVTKNPYDKYFGSGKQIKSAIAKYGIENFKKEILFIFNNKEEMSAKEKEIVNEDFCKRLDTYNMHEGGEGGWGHVRSSPEYKSYCKRGGKNSSGKLHPNWGRNKWKAGDLMVKEISKKANEHRIKFGLSAEHKAKISAAAKLREEERRKSGYYKN